LPRLLLVFFAKQKGHSREVIEWIKRDDTSVHDTEDLLATALNIWTLRPSKETLSRLTRKRDDLLLAVDLARIDTEKSLFE
jgi:hypothetical protein